MHLRALLSSHSNEEMWLSLDKVSVIAAFTLQPRSVYRLSWLPALVANVLLSVDIEDADWSFGPKLIGSIGAAVSWCEMSMTRPPALQNPGLLDPESHVPCYSWLTSKATPLSGFPKCTLPWQRETPFPLSQALVALSRHCSACINMNEKLPWPVVTCSLSAPSDGF